MKAFTLVTALTIALFSGAAFAERGAGEDNKIAYPESTAQHQANDTNFVPSELPYRNP